MVRLITVVAICGLWSLASGQVVMLGEVKAKHAVQLSTDDLKQLLPDAKIVQHTVAGSTRRWTNNGNGTFVASSDGFSLTMGQYDGGTGQGTWRIDEERGTFCVTLQWIRLQEEWCRYILRAGEKFYGFDKLTDDSERGGEWEISR